MRRSKLHLLILILALLIPTALVFAQIDSVILNDGTNDLFEVDLVEWGNNPDGTTSFTYAVTDLGSANALSHWHFGIGSCLGSFLESPLPDDTYNPPLDVDSCEDGTYACSSVPYTVETGTDPSTGSTFTGIKFEVATTEQLQPGETQIFQITVNNFLSLVELPLVAKVGSSDTGGDETILGPECAVPTAISLSSTNVESLGGDTLLPVALVMVLMMTIATITVWRKRAGA